MSDASRGATRVIFRDGRPSALEVRRIRLRVGGKDSTFDSDVVRIGSDAGNDLVIDDPTVSRRHAEIRAQPDGFLLSDLGSTNGTRVAGHRVREIFLEAGSVAELGKVSIRFEPLAETVQLELAEAERCGPLVGRSVAMRRIFSLLERLARGQSTVLVEGETGTGKELVAEALHGLGPRADGPFVTLDCSAMPRDLIESELLGHEKGAFTGATQSRRGAFEEADGGTIFLDEIGELPLELQPKLLRVLERREIRRVGGSGSRTVDVRVVAATNRDLSAEVNRGAFRSDLYYRLAVVRITMPSLRERPEDIPLLVDHFVSRLAAAEGRVFTLEPETVAMLSAHDWPGNVRELRNALERAVALQMPEKPIRVDLDGAPLQAAADEPLDFKEARAQILERFEREYIAKALERSGGNISAAARAAGLNRKHVEHLVRKHGLR
ncbi:MAG: sigma 54-interacting transcriptional regulator [Deltaproteobacteria bacterium]|nr:sigma 54-interacting transcriptional regulator [Deltaproteobacteria bacterium]